MNTANPKHCLILGFASLLVAAIIYFTDDYTNLKIMRCVVTSKPNTAEEMLDYTLGLTDGDKDFKFRPPLSIFNHAKVGDTLYLPLKGKDIETSNVNDIIYEFIQPMTFVMSIMFLTIAMVVYEDQPPPIPLPTKSLQQQLDEAVEAEDYLLAVKLRNRMKKLPKNLQ